MTERNVLAGTVVKAYGKWYEVALDGDERILLSSPKGLLKRERRGTDLIAVGDRVTVTDVGDNEGRIESIEPRTSVLARLARKTRDTEQVLVANPDQALFIFSSREPIPHPRMLDRFLVLAESRELPARVALNKADLVREGDPEIFTELRSIYPVHDVSVHTGEGLDELRTHLTGKITVVAGPSGVGKSSLVNALIPGRAQATALVSDATGKGRHTTTAAQLFRMDADSFIADTPGIRSLVLQGVEMADLPHYYPEFRPFLGSCRFNNCTHVMEPGCAIQAAVEGGAISRTRFESYCSLRRGDTDD